MDTKDVADLFITATDKIEFNWHFDAVMLIALIGWLARLPKHPLAASLTLVITVGYSSSLP